MARFTISTLLYHYSFEHKDKVQQVNKKPYSAASVKEPVIMMTKTERNKLQIWKNSSRRIEW